MNWEEHEKKVGAPMTEQEARKLMGYCLLFGPENATDELGSGVLSVMLEEQKKEGLGLWYFVILSYQLGVMAGKRAERKRRKN